MVTIGIFLWFIIETRRFDYPIALSVKRQLVMYLKEAGILESDQRNNTRKIKGVPQNHIRYLYLKRDMIEKKLKEEAE